MVRLYVRHEVDDYDAWRSVYDEFDTERRSMGVTGDAVYRGVDDGRQVTVWHDFASRDEADAFVGSDRLRDVMQRAGVVGRPDVWLVDEA